jgi:hypothetical protein
MSLKLLKKMIGRIPPVKQLLQLTHSVRTMDSKLSVLTQLSIDEYMTTHLYGNPKYHNPKKLNKYEYQVYSQNGEDGIIDEIFKRIGHTNHYCVEFGVGNGLENNTVYLLSKDWTGYWVEGEYHSIRTITKNYYLWIQMKKLQAKHAFVTVDNVEGLLYEAATPHEYDLLSIDIDGNDYWVWDAIKSYHARVVVIEYNALYPPHVAWIKKYDPHWVWDGTAHFGASLKSLEILGNKKGYRLVGCSFIGSNAFFVRTDLVEDKFDEPFSAENHYEPPRYYLLRSVGHAKSHRGIVNT